MGNTRVEPSRVKVDKATRRSEALQSEDVNFRHIRSAGKVVFDSFGVHVVEPWRPAERSTIDAIELTAVPREDTSTVLQQSKASG